MTAPVESELDCKDVVAVSTNVRMSLPGRSEFELGQTIAPDGTVRLAVVGELDLAGADALSQRLGELKRSGERVRLDLSRLRFIDSAGIRAVLVGVADARRDGWELEVGHELSGQVERVIKTWEFLQCCGHRVTSRS